MKIVIIFSLVRVRGKPSILAPPEGSVLLPGSLRRLGILMPCVTTLGVSVGRGGGKGANVARKFKPHGFEKCSAICSRPWEPEITLCLVHWFSLTRLYPGMRSLTVKAV